MPNHLTPDELSKELGMERQEVIRVCVEEGVPIYQGYGLTETLFQAQLAAIGALPPKILSCEVLRTSHEGGLGMSALRACLFLLLKGDRYAEGMRRCGRAAPWAKRSAWLGASVMRSLRPAGSRCFRAGAFFVFFDACSTEARSFHQVDHRRSGSASTGAVISWPSALPSSSARRLLR